MWRTRSTHCKVFTGPFFVKKGYDQDVLFSLKEIFIPFLAHNDTFPIGFGIIALYIMALLVICLEQ